MKLSQKDRESLISRHVCSRAGRIALIQAIAKSAREMEFRVLNSDPQFAFECVVDIIEMIDIAHRIERYGTPFLSGKYEGAEEFEFGMGPFLERAEKTASVLYDEGFLLVWGIMRS